MFRGFPQDKLKLIKSNGKIIENINAIISKEKIVIDNPNVPLEIGDLLIRTLPNKIEEKFEIIDYSFYQKTFNISAHFQVEYKRYNDNKKEEINNNNHSNNSTYHIQNSNVIIGSKNSSINISQNDKLFKDMIEVANNLTNQNKTEIISLINEMQDNINKPTFNDKYKEFMSISADTITVFTPFLGALAGLLQ